MPYNRDNSQSLSNSVSSKVKLQRYHKSSNPSIQLIGSIFEVGAMADKYVLHEKISTQIACDEYQAWKTYDQKYR